MNTTEPRLLRVEVVGDLPILWATLQRLELPAILDRHFPAPLHWKGPLTPGEVLTVWLLFLVSQADHCLDPDRPQFKVAAAVLDPLGLPLATIVVPGNTADDPLYVPAIQAVRPSLGTGGRTYIGDCKMGSLATRAFVAAGGDFYLCPLAESQLSRAGRRELLHPVWQGTQTLEQVRRPGPEAGLDELVAE